MLAIIQIIINNKKEVKMQKQILKSLAIKILKMSTRMTFYKKRLKYILFTIGLITSALYAENVTITGILKNYDGKPVKDGFVILKNNPRLCTMTDGLGQFRIQGKAWSLPDTLLASWSGCDTTETSITKAEVKNLVINLKAEDPEFTKIETGGAIKITRYVVKNLLAKIDKGGKRTLSADMKTCISAYETFLKDKGESIIRKITTGTKLTAEESKYQYLLHAEIMVRVGQSGRGKLFGDKPSKNGTIKDCDYLRDYCIAISKEGKNALAKGYLKERLTEADVHAIRCYVTMRTVFAPNRGLRIKDSAVSSNEYLSFPKQGEKALDITFLKLDPILNSLSYSNHAPLCLTEFVRLESLATAFAHFAAYKLNDNNKLEPSLPVDLSNKYWRDEEQMISLTELRKSSSKPVVAIWLTSEKIYDVLVPRFAEYLYQAYKDKAEIVLIFGQPWIAFYMPEDQYYDFPKPNPLHGIVDRIREGHATPTRLARLAKICVMNSILSTPLLIETAGNTFEEEYFMKGRWLISIIDKDGILVDNRHSNLARQGGFSKSWLGPNSYPYKTSTLQVVEKKLQSLIKNNGKYSSDMDTKILYPTYSKRLFAKHDLFVVKSFDKEKQTLHAGWIKPKSRGFSATTNGKIEPDLDFHFKINSDTRLALNQKDGKAYWDPSAKTDEGGYKGISSDYSVLQPGDKFYADIIIDEKDPCNPRKNISEKIQPNEGLKEFDMKKYAGRLLETVRIQNFLDGTERNVYQGGYLIGSSMPAYGNIIKIDGKIITVKISQEHIKKMSGYRFWKQNESEKTADITTDDTEQAIKAVSVLNRWADGTDEDRTYRFCIDPAVRLSVNGEVEKKLSDLSVGDYVFVEYHMWYEIQHKGKCLIYPEVIRARHY
jgi:hypothetical protein